MHHQGSGVLSRTPLSSLDEDRASDALEERRQPGVGRIVRADHTYQGVRNARVASRPAMLFSLEGSSPGAVPGRVGFSLRGRPLTLGCLGASAYLENCIATVGVLYLISGQDIKGTRWMPWRQKPKKDVDGCDKPR